MYKFWAIFLVSILGSMTSYCNEKFDNEMLILSKMQVDRERGTFVDVGPFLYINEKMAYRIKELNAAKSLQKKGLITGVDLILKVIENSTKEKFSDDYVLITVNKSFSLEPIVEAIEKLQSKFRSGESEVLDGFGKEEQEKTEKAVYSIHQVTYVLTKKGEALKKEFYNLLQEPSFKPSDWQAFKYSFNRGDKKFEELMALKLPKVSLGFTSMFSLKNYLREMTLNRDPYSRGLNLVIKADVKDEIKVKVELTNTSIEELLMVICEQTGLNFKAENSVAYLGQREMISSQTYLVPHNFTKQVEADKGLKSFLTKRGLTFPGKANVVLLNNRTLVLNNSDLNKMKLNKILNRLNIWWRPLMGR